MKKLTSVLLLSGALAGLSASAASTFYWQGGENDSPTNISCYSTDQWGARKVPPALPAAGDTVYLCENCHYRVTDDVADWVGTFARIQPRNTCHVIFDIETDHAFGCEVRLWGSSVVYKRGAGTATFTCEDFPDSQGRHYEYNTLWRIEEGKVVFPTGGLIDVDKVRNIGGIWLAEGTEVVLPNTKQIYLYGLSGSGRVTSGRAAGTETQLYLRDTYEGNRFSGVLSDDIELRPYVSLSLLNVSNEHNSCYICSSAKVGARLLGSEKKSAKSSLGMGTDRTTLNGYDVGILNLATEEDGPQVSTRRYWDYGGWDIYSSPKRFQRTIRFDAGAYGGLNLTNTDIRAMFTRQLKQFILTGSNTVESTFGGNLYGQANSGTPAESYGWYTLLKQGTGRWTLTKFTDGSGTPMHLGGICVEQGELGYTSLAERGKMCSLGRGETNFFGYAWVGSLTNPPPRVDYSVRLGCPTNAAREVVFDYCGSAEGSATNRMIGLVGSAVLRNSSAKPLTWGGVKSVPLAEDGTSPAALTLTLDGEAAVTNRLGAIGEEGAALSLAKKGDSIWLVEGEARFSGSLQVDAGALVFAGAAPVVSNFVVDVRQGLGALSNVVFAAEGTLTLTNIVGRETDLVLPFDGCSNVDNITNWCVRTAIPDGFDYRVTVEGGMLRVRRLSLVLTAENVNVVVAYPEKSGTLFAAAELTNAFYHAFGAAPAVKRNPVAGKINIFLGDNNTARSVGLESANLPYDGFVIRVDPDTERIYIVGEDTGYSPFMRNPKEYAATPRYPHATAFGVYELLERFAGCRFYFAGRYGTIYPKRTELELPGGDIADAPDHAIRSYYYITSAKMPEGSDVKSRENYNLNWMRHRLETQNIPCSHGTIRFKYLERFGESNPEYFALRSTNGVARHNYFDGSSHSLNGHLCWSSAITNEIYLDAKAYLTRGSAEERGITGGWGKNCQQYKYVDIMPNDGYPGCKCPTCLSNRVPGDYYETFTIWNATRTIAQRLIDEGVPGYVTQMSYGAYNQMPDFDLPTNVLVMVAKRGPWSIYDAASYEKQKKAIRDWSAKLGGNRVWMWNYENKYNETNIKNIPQMSPRAWGAFYREMGPHVFGSFAEAETDRWYFNHLNYYVYSKLSWRNSQDVDAILDDYYENMYGAAADDVREFFEALEDIWLKEIACRMEETEEGPMSRTPSELQAWREIYTTERLDAWGELFDRAAAKLDPASLEAERLALCRQEMLDVMVSAREAYMTDISVEHELARRARRPGERRRDICDNGDFIGTTKTRFFPNGPYDVGSGRNYSWFTGDEFVPFPTTGSTFVTGTQCAVITGFVNKASHICQYLPTLKPNHTYRISMFLKGENIQSASGSGGAGVTIMDRYNNSYPTTARFDGTFDWIHYSFLHTTNPDTRGPDAPTPYIRIGLSSGCTGRLHVDGVQIVDTTEKDGFVLLLMGAGLVH